MAAKDNLSNYQFQLDPRNSEDEDIGGTAAIHAKDATTGKYAGSLIWRQHGGGVDHVEVWPEHQNKGIATHMWKLAQQAHKDAPFHYSEIHHSNFRTVDGDAWAHSLWKKGLAERVPYNDMIDESNEPDDLDYDPEQQAKYDAVYDKYKDLYKRHWE